MSSFPKYTSNQESVIALRAATREDDQFPAPAVEEHKQFHAHREECNCWICKEMVVVVEEKAAPSEPDEDEIWEAHSELFETISCGMVGDETLMRRSEFSKAFTKLAKPQPDSSSISTEQTFRSNEALLRDILSYCRSRSDNHPKFDMAIREACIKLQGFDPDERNAAKGSR